MKQYFKKQDLRYRILQLINLEAVSRAGANYGEEIRSDIIYYDQTSTRIIE